MKEIVRLDKHPVTIGAIVKLPALYMNIHCVFEYELPRRRDCARI
jgi:hypothetical protein